MTENNDNIEEVEGIVEPEPMALVPSVGKGLNLNDEEMLALLEIRTANMRGIRLKCLKVLDPVDFTMISGKPHLNVSGVTKIARLFGVSWSKPEISDKIWGEKADGTKFYTIEAMVEGRMGLSADRQETAVEIGTATTYDNFFMRNKKHPPAHDVDINMVKKKAVTNARGRCLRALGLSSFTNDEFKAVGMKSDDISGYKHKTGSQGGQGVTSDLWKELTTQIGLKISTPDKPSDFIKYFKTNGFTKPQITTIIDKLSKVDETEKMSSEDFEAICEEAHNA